MEKRSLALQNVSEAIRLDSKGFHQTAFVKYLESLQSLSLYLNDLYKECGFQKLLENKKEVKQVLSAVKESSGRVIAILDMNDTKKINTSGELFKGGNVTPKNENPPTMLISRFPVFEKMQNQNLQLFRNYQQRIERASDKYAKTNLRLELQRRMAENEELARTKYALAVKDFQKENLNIMEQKMKKLFENGKSLSNKELEKKELYTSVLQYSSSETWPYSLINTSHDQPQSSMQNVCQKVISCSEHPLNQWINKIQTKVKLKIDDIRQQYLKYEQYLPDHDLHSNKTNRISFLISSSQASIHLDSDNESVNIPLKIFSRLHKDLEPISCEIHNTIEDILQVFYLTYKSFFPEDSQSICRKIVETYFVGPLWADLFILYRLVNLPNEYKVLETMLHCKSSLPEKFGSYLNNDLQFSEIYRDIILKLRKLPNLSSITEKLQDIVQVSQKLCEGDLLKAVEPEKRFIGADDFIPLLCYVIVQSETYCLVSECYALEQLFDKKCMFGEEGYALSSFLTALMYLETKKFIKEETSHTNDHNTEV